MNQAITLSQIAWHNIAKQLADTDQSAVRLAVKPAGCSGYSYTMALSTIEKQDTLIQEGQGRIAIDPKSLQLLQGIAIDYVDDGINEGFVFSNPNAKGTCGCGESFTV